MIVLYLHKCKFLGLCFFVSTLLQPGLLLSETLSTESFIIRGNASQGDTYRDARYLVTSTGATVSHDLELVLGAVADLDASQARRIQASAPTFQVSPNRGLRNAGVPTGGDHSADVGRGGAPWLDSNTRLDSNPWLDFNPWLDGAPGSGSNVPITIDSWATPGN
jgi:hypothetical protein